LSEISDLGGFETVFDVCPACGIFDEEKTVDPRGPYAICPHCDYGHPFVRLPLFVLTGASGAGKSALCLQLCGKLAGCVCLETDIYWRPEFATPDDDYHAFRNLCLRTAKNISQSGQRVMLCGSATPGQFEVCSQSRYFADIHYLALVCDDDVLVERLRQRPAWRNASSEAFINTMLSYNNWFRENAGQHGLTLLDTSYLSQDGSAARVMEWYIKAT
jgi:hypothetical protein